MAITTQRRSLLRADSPPQLSASTRHELAAAAAVLPRLLSPMVAIGKFQPQLDAHGKQYYSPEQLKLQHYLSDAMEAARGGIAPRLDDRTEHEYAVFLHVRDAYLQTMSSSQDNYPALIEEIASRVVGRRMRLRTGEMKLRAVGATAVSLPSASAARLQLRFLAQALVTSGEPSLANAIWHYVLFLNAHPLLDGNGRSARILFNLELLRLGARAESYVPLASAMRASRGGYEIRLREAEVFGRWDPIASYLATVIAMSARTEESE